MGLRSVLDEHDAGLARDRRQSEHVGGHPEQVNRDERARPRGEGRGNPGWVHPAPDCLDVDPDGHRADLAHRDPGRDCRHRGHEHLVTGLDPRRAESERERVGPAADTDRVRGAAEAGPLELERLDLLGEDVAPAVEHRFERLHQLRPHRQQRRGGVGGRDFFHDGGVSRSARRYSS